MRTTITSQKRYITRITVIIFFVFFFVQNTFAKASDSEKILIISSYSPDSKRVSDFLRDIENIEASKKYDYSFIIENMNCGSLLDYQSWRIVMNKILKKHENSNIIGIILLGQEAWATFVSEKKQSYAPFYGCFASENGVIVPQSDKEFDRGNLKSVNMVALADSIGHSGGVFNRYSIEKNVELAKLIYPDTKSVALLTDCTYGGISLAALFEKVMKAKYPSIGYTLLNGRKYSVDELHNIVKKLDRNTAILIGTWRVDNQGTFTLHETLSYILNSRKDLPIFSISGVGVGSFAVGGYYSDYSNNIDIILEDIHNYNAGERDGKRVTFNSNYYWFNESKMNEYGIRPFQIPSESRILDDKNAALERYRTYTFAIAILASIFLIALVFAILFYIQNRKSNKALQIQRNKLQRQNEELVEAKKEAEKSDKLKSAFLANMSHEIRTPLNAIVGFSELIKDSEEPEDKETYWDIISTNNDLLLRLIGDILDLSKIEAGMIDLKPVRFDMTELINSLNATIGQRCKNPEVTLIHECQHKRCFVTLDKNRVSQVLTNFLTNALKFTEKGHIRFGYDCFDNGVRIYCEDTGIGIAPEKIDNVFKRFYKLNNFAQGSGLGMAICKAIIDEMNGRIGVDSTIGKGSFFWAWIPVDTEISD